MNTTLTKEQRERLKPYETHLKSAFYADYVVGLGQHITEGTLWPVYIEVFGEHPGRYSCNFCVMKVCKKLGRLYFETKEPDTPAQPEPASQQHTKPKKAPQKAKKTTKK